MSIQPWRGGAAFLRQPVNEDDLLADEFDVEMDLNVRSSVTTPLPDIEYRSSDRGRDVLRDERFWGIPKYEYRGYTAWRTEDNSLYNININFNPQAYPARLLRTCRPGYYMDEDSHRRSLVTENGPQRQLMPIYGNRVTNFDGYIDAAFRCTWRNVAYIFFGAEYVLLDYAPGTTNDRIVSGPHSIGSSFRSLAGTAFAEYGIDAAFGCHDRGGNEAMIFCRKLCARINYAPGTTDDWIIEGPKTIRKMFPFFRGTNFESGIDAGFESTVTGEAYLFKGSEYALIDYSTPARLIAIRPIRDGFKCFRNTMFENDIGAAFASHVKNQAYLFKGNNYVHFRFTPGRNGDYIIGGPKAIVPANWPSLNAVLPRKNCGL